MGEHPFSFTARIDPAVAVQFLPAALRTWASPSLAISGLLSGAMVLFAGEATPSLQRAMRATEEIFGADYCAGFVDGVCSGLREGKRSVRYVYGLDDGSQLRGLLRRLAWGRELFDYFESSLDPGLWPPPWVRGATIPEIMRPERRGFGQSTRRTLPARGQAGDSCTSAGTRGEPRLNSSPSRVSLRK